MFFFHQFAEALETKRAEACKSEGGLVLKVSSLEPAMASIANLLDDPQLKGLIPPQAVLLFARTRQLLNATSVDMCNNEAVHSILRLAELTIGRDLKVLDRVLEPYCAAYQKFLESQNGKILVADLNQTLRDALLPGPVPVESVGKK